MPYRRLPNTDDARIRSLRTVVEREVNKDIHELILTPRLLNETVAFLPNFERVKKNYVEALALQVNSNLQFQSLGKNARLYVSHFIQVLNLCIIRKEIKEEAKLLFGLEPDEYSVPDLTSDTDLLKWGESIINGEYERIHNGGAPVYNPAIAKVKVHYDLFKEAYHSQKYLQKNTARTLDELAALREKADTIIRNVWNEIEARFENMPSDDKLVKCREYGVIYYYRKGETVKP